MKNLKRMLLPIFAFSVTASSFSQDVFKNKDNVANNGYDLVNYFTANTAERGSKDHLVSHGGADYYFATADNAKMFSANPEKFLPQFDGYCSFAMAKMAQKAPVDPKTFRIDDGKLYLFYNDYWEGKPFNTIVPWLNDEKTMETMAAKNWTAMQGKQ